MAKYIGDKFGQEDHARLVQLDSCVLPAVRNLLLRVKSAYLRLSGPGLQADYETRVDPNNKQAQDLLDEMRAHVKKVWNCCSQTARACACLPAVSSASAAVEKGMNSFSLSGHVLKPEMRLQLEEMRKNEDPRLSFSTPEFKEAQRMFTDGLKVHTHAQQEHHSVDESSDALQNVPT